MHFLENSENPESAVVLVARDHNFYSQDFIRHATGETVSAPESIQKISGKTELSRPSVSSAKQIMDLIQNLR